MKMFKQLLKEFFLPLLGALLWVAFNYDGDLKLSMTLFGGTFFFLSWLTSQFFRVKKQTATETSLLNIRADIERLLGELQSKTDNLIGHVTGGQTFCRVEFGFNNEGRCQTVFLWPEGEHAVHDVHIRICNIELLQSLAAAGLDTSASETHLPVTPLAYTGMVHLIPADFGIGTLDHYRFNIFVDAKNGSLVQLSRGIRKNGKWARAIQIRWIFDDNPVYVMIDDDFPRNVKGEVDWS